MANDISNSENILDSRNIQERIDELESLESDVTEAESALEDAEGDEDTDAAQEALGTARENFDGDLQSELKTLRDIAEEVGSEWRHGVTLIRDDHFTEYCEELVSDIGDLPSDVPSYIVIDWEATANNLRMDYSTVDYDGQEYLYRS